MEDPAELLGSKAELDQEEMERLLRENRALKGRLDELERENRLLKQRNFDLSMRYGRSVENRKQPFELVFSESDASNVEDNDGNSEERHSEYASDNNEISGTGYSLEESESGREGNDADDRTEFSNSTGQSIDASAGVSGGNGSDFSASLGKSPRAEGKVWRADVNKCRGTKDSNDRSNNENNDGSNPVRSSGDSKAPGQGTANGPGPTMNSLPLQKEHRPREKPKRGSDKSDVDRDGSARYADVEPAPREKSGVRDSEDRHGAGSGTGGTGGTGAGAGAGGGGSSGASSRRKEAKQIKCYAELDGHEGAIYSTQYSPAGNLIASASFDKTVRIWDIAEQKPAAVLEGHQQSVFDVAWREDSAALVSASFDRTCIEWDIESKAAATRLQCSGLVQCVRYSTHNPRIVYAGDSSGFISIHDTRQPHEGTKLSNDGAMVNTMYCFSDETRLVSGDRNGDIKMWDVRIGNFMRLVSADAQKRAISHISVVKNEKSGTEYMAVNSYDNVLRVYDRVDDPSVPTPRVIHELRGVRNRNWPVKNAFFDPQLAQARLLRLYNDDYYELDMRSQNEARGLGSMLFMLTGSAEPFAYLYRLSTHSKMVGSDDKAKRGTRQRLEGHSDRVYAVATHPAEIKACTAGADTTIRLWHVPSSGRLLLKEGY